MNKTNPNLIDRHATVDTLNALYDNINADTTLDPHDKTVMLIALMRALMCVFAQPEIKPVDTLKPCDPSLLDKPLDEFLRIVDDASVYGLEVVICDGKPYYRERVDC